MHGFFSLSAYKDTKSRVLRMYLCSLECVGLGKEARCVDGAESLHCWCQFFGQGNGEKTSGRRTNKKQRETKNERTRTEEGVGASVDGLLHVLEVECESRAKQRVRANKQREREGQ